MDPFELEHAIDQEENMAGAQKAAAAIGETVARFQKLVENPSPEALGPINFDELDERDKPFFEKLLTLAQVDPDILRRVLIMRHKLNNSIKLTQKEAEELIEVLGCKGFYFTDLDLVGKEFGILDLSNAVVGGDFITEGAVVRYDNSQSDMQIGGSNFQEDMQIGGSNFQREVKIGKDNNQQGMKIGGENFQGQVQIGGSNNQQGMQIKWGSNDQREMQIGWSNSQEEMQIGGDNVQVMMQIGENNFQEEMQIGRINNQREMKIGGDNFQKRMKVRGNNQQGMKIKGVNDQEGMEIF